jgi:hypothetical protein
MKIYDDQMENGSLIVQTAAHEIFNPLRTDFFFQEVITGIVRISYNLEMIICIPVALALFVKTETKNCLIEKDIKYAIISLENIQRSSTFCVPVYIRAQSEKD